MEKNKVILVNPSLGVGVGVGVDGSFASRVYPYPALMVYVTMLHHAGYEVVFIDGSRSDFNGTLKQIESSIDESLIFIGFSVMTTMVPWTFKIIKELKLRYPEQIIVLGGMHPSIYPEQTVRDENVDIVAVDEFTSTMLGFTETLKNGGDLNNVPSIMFKENGKVIATERGEKDDLEKIPLVDYDLLDIEYYKKNNALSYPIPSSEVSVGHILTGLGCTHKCTFCYVSISDKRYRFRSADVVVDRIEYLQKKYGIDLFYFTDEDFFASQKRMNRFIELVEERKLKFRFRAYARVSYFKNRHLNVEVLKKLESLGLFFVAMGAESGNDHVLQDMLEKKIAAKDTRQAVSMVSETSIMPSLSFMVGMPDEKEDEIRDTYMLALELLDKYKNIECEVVGFALYPGNKLSDEAARKYELGLPESLEEWASISYEENADLSSPFYGPQKRPWVKNTVEFNRQLQYFSMYKKAVIRVHASKNPSIILKLLRSMIRLRFKYNFFYLPFEAWLNNLRVRNKIFLPPADI